MKKIIFTLFFAIMATTGLYAQQISVVSSGGTTSLYRTLPEAIKGAAPGSVIYLPGGGFSIDDSVKITKKLTIIGIGHKSNYDNVDGVTTILGNLFFNGGSNGSSVMGCYITGNINIGSDNTSVNDILIRYCNALSVRIISNICLGTVVNQNYIRGPVGFSNYPYASAEITNNVIYYISGIRGGVISNNIITHSSSTSYALSSVFNTVVTGNIFLPTSYIYSVRDDLIGSVLSNMGFGNLSCDEDYINLKGINPNDVFENYNNGKVDPSSDFHFKEAYKQYENKVGVYANGTDFDKQLAPVPYIVAKQIPEQTDAQGKLNIKIRVKAGQ